MGSEIYAYFGYEGGDIEVAELQELEADSGANEARGMQEGSRAVARLGRHERTCAPVRRPPCGSTRASCTCSTRTAGASLTRDPDPKPAAETAPAPA